MIGSKTHTLNAILSLDGEKASRERAKAFAPDRESVSKTRTRSIRGQGEPLMPLNDRGVPSPLPATKKSAGHEGAIVRPGSSMPVEIPTTGVPNREREASLEPKETTSELEAMHVPDHEDNTDLNEESMFSASEETSETSENTHSTSVSRVDQSDDSKDSNYYPSKSGMSKGGTPPSLPALAVEQPSRQRPLTAVSRQHSRKSESGGCLKAVVLKAVTLQAVALQVVALKAVALQGMVLQAAALQAVDIQEEMDLQASTIASRLMRGQTLMTMRDRSQGRYSSTE
jgi:hypothetical protein